MKKIMKKLSVILLLLWAVGLFKSAYATNSMVNQEKSYRGNLRFPQRNKVQDDSTLLNKPAPKFELHDLTGKICSLENLKGKIVVLNFWFIACKPCVNEMPVLNEIKKNYDPAKVVFLALSLDGKEAINAFLQNHKFDYNILPKAASVGEKYNIYAYPTSMVINARGIISFVQIGGPNIGGNLRAAINVALKSL
jgi:peroxiredoxin